MWKSQFSSFFLPGLLGGLKLLPLALSVSSPVTPVLASQSLPPSLGRADVEANRMRQVPFLLEYYASTRWSVRRLYP